jgi:hypothetical protein
MKRFPRALLCVLVSSVGLVAAGYKVSGTVTDYIKNSPASSCLIMLRGLSPSTSTDSTRTGADGTYAFANVPAGVYQIIESDSRYVADTVQSTISGDTTFAFTVYETAHVLQAGKIPDTLSKTGSPYIVKNWVRINNPATMQAGAEMVFIKDAALILDSSFSAQGTAEDSVRFSGQYSLAKRKSMGIDGPTVYLNKNYGNYIFNFCQFKNMSEFAIYPVYSLRIVFENCLFEGMNDIFGFSSHQPENLIFKHNRAVNCENGLIGTQGSMILADTFEMCDNFLQCSQNAMYFGFGKKTSIRRNTMFGIVTIDVYNVSPVDTIVSNIFGKVVDFENSNKKTVFFAYNDLMIGANAPPLGVGNPALTNANGDSCDFYYNIIKNPLFSDSLTGSLQKISPCIAAGLGGENMGVYQDHGTRIGERQYSLYRVQSTCFKILSAKNDAAGTIVITAILPSGVQKGDRVTIYALSGRKLLILPLTNRGNGQYGATSFRISKSLSTGSYIITINYGDYRCFTRFTIDH